MLWGSGKKVIRGMPSAAQSQVGLGAWGWEPMPTDRAGASDQIPSGILAPPELQPEAAASASERKALGDAEGFLASCCLCPGW